MVAIPLPLTTMPGRHPQESAGRLVNMYAEPLGEGARAPAARRRVPGLSSWGTTSETGFRGMQLLGSVLYAAWSGEVFRFTSAGGAGTSVGALAGTAKVTWARNNAASPNLVLVSPGDGAFVVTSGAVTAYPDADLPAPNSVCFQQGYFFFTIGDGRIFASGINSTSVNALDFATAESKPDTLYRAIPMGTGQLLLAGSSSLEVWGPPINATGFPFSYITTIPIGLISQYAIAGHEDGFGKGIVFVGNDNAVHVLSGYKPEKISPPDLDALIEEVADKTEIEVGVFVSRGHPFAVVSCDAWTWVFDLNTLKWHERESYLQTRWRGTQPHYAFDKWLVGDTDSGNILSVDAASNQEVGDPLRARLESGPVNSFPQRMRVARVDFDITTGVGLVSGTDPDQTDPQVEISWSDDGGLYWSEPMFRKLGRQAVGRYPVSINSTGMTSQKGRRWRLDISDPVDFAIMAGDMSAEVRRA